LAFPEPPTIDAHAHIATDVTPAQVRRLGTSAVFAVTRSPSEAASAPHGVHQSIIWGLGVHPAVRQALDRYDGSRFDKLLPKFTLVGEIGLDRRAGKLDEQKAVLADVLGRLIDVPMLVSLHSTGAVDDVLLLLNKHPVRAPILHWFGGTPDQCRKAIDLGSWFSVNAAMSAQVIRALPPDRILSETDFPFTRRWGGTRPGATQSAEALLADAWSCSPAEVRRLIWSNFSVMCTVAGVRSRLPRAVTEVLDQQKSRPQP
jgi:TatD DNase family protein